MRYAHLQAYLETVLPPAQVNTLIAAFELLFSAGIDGQDYQIQQELALAEDGDTSITVQSIYNLATPLMVITLGNFGIKLKEEATLAELVDVLNGIISLENYCDAATILQYCDNAEGPEEALSEILPFVGAYSVGHYMGLIEDVNPMLLERIEAVMRIQLQETPVNREMLAQIRNRLLKFARKVGQYDLLAIVEVRAGARLGMPLVSYLEPHLQELDNLATDTHDVTDLVYQILAFVLASDTPDDKVREVCNNEFDALLPDKAKVTQADVLLLKLLAE